jgi:hypothetical protein
MILYHEATVDDNENYKFMTLFWIQLPTEYYKSHYSIN